jgi:hypothetical protein
MPEASTITAPVESSDKGSKIDLYLGGTCHTRHQG